MLATTTNADRSRKMQRAGVSLGEYVKGEVYLGILTGFNEAFYIDAAKRAELIAQDAHSAEIIRPLAVGRDIKRWSVNFRNEWQIFTPVGIDIERYPAIMQHLRQWQPELEKRQNKGKHYWELRACAYYGSFEKPKIIYPQIMNEPQFAYDETGTITNQKCYIITNVDMFLLGVLNSSTIWKLIVEGSPTLRGGYSEPRRNLIMSLPIPNATPEQKEEIAALVQMCLDARGVGCAAWEEVIDARVAALYGLS